VHEFTFRAILNTIANSVTLANPKDEMERCVFTDASAGSDAIMITQVSIGDLTETLQQQQR
jgi:hypothetical protein